MFQFRLILGVQITVVNDSIQHANWIIEFDSFAIIKF